MEGAMSANRQKDVKRKYMIGYRPVVNARQGLMLGIRNPLDGPVFASYQDALGWCIDAMIDHHERGFGMSEGRIEPFKGMVSC